MGALFNPSKPKGPQRMPDENDPATRDAEERKRRQIVGRSGRASTMLTRRGEAGTAAYTNSLLGSAG